MAGLGPGNPGFDNLDPLLQQIALAIINESGGRVWIGSGWRSIEEQTRLYNAWVSGNYNVPAVAKPGRSKHNHGRAIDFDGDLRLAQQLGRKYGLIFPVKGEAWHGELSGAGKGADFGPAGNVAYDLNYMGPQENPEDVLANRLQAVMRTLGQTDTTMLWEPEIMDDMGGIDPLAYEQAGGTPWELASAAFPMSDMAAGVQAKQDLKDAERSPVFTLDYNREKDQPVHKVVDARDFGTYAQSLFPQFGFDAADFPALVELWNRESGDPKAGSSKVTWNPLAQNPTSTAFGIAQFLNGTWAGTGVSKTTNAQKQILAGLIYIRSRYGNPRNALAFHTANNWY